MLHRDVVKGLHEKLRKEVAGGAPPEDVWEKNKSDEDSLSAYSQAMHQLGKEWDQKGGSVPERVKWIIDTTTAYFRGTASTDTKRPKPEIEVIPTLTKLRLKEIKRTHFSEHGTPMTESDAAIQTEILQTETIKQFPVTETIELLDVGSCYNPSAAYASKRGISVTAIDLCPSLECSDPVYTCDFLTVRVGDKLQVEPYSRPSAKEEVIDESGDLQSKLGLKRTASEQEPPPPTSERITQLKTKSFDVVTFCLLLSYFPCSGMRFKCLQNAFRVLKHNGLLIIITTKTVGPKSLEWLKAWNQTLELIGFSRAAQEIRQKIICLAYRKVACEEEPLEVPQEMRKVPIGAD